MLHSGNAGGLHTCGSFSSYMLLCVGMRALLTWRAALQGDVNDWLVTFCYFFGDTLWMVAVIFQMVEALNPGYDARVFEWQQEGCKGPKPRCHNRHILLLIIRVTRQSILHESI